MLEVARKLRQERDRDDKLQNQKHEQRNFVSSVIVCKNSDKFKSYHNWQQRVVVALSKYVNVKIIIADCAK